jgi:hypothetical protein
MYLQYLSTLPLLPQALHVELERSLRDGQVIAEGTGENSWSYKEQLPNSTLNTWLIDNISSAAAWKINSGEKDGSGMLHIESEPRQGLKFLYVVESEKQSRKVIWSRAGQLLHTDDILVGRWYIFRTSLEHETL